MIDHLGEHRDPTKRRYSRESLDHAQVSYQPSLPHVIVFGGLSSEFQSMESSNKNLEVELQVALIYHSFKIWSFVCDKLTVIFK